MPTRKAILEHTRTLSTLQGRVTEKVAQGRYDISYAALALGFEALELGNWQV